MNTDAKTGAFTLLGWDSPRPLSGVYEVVIRAPGGPEVFVGRLTALECQRLCLRVETPDYPAKPIVVDATWTE